MSWEQRNADFCKAQTEAQMAYIEAERMVAKLQDENVKLRELCKELLDLCYDAYNQEWGWDDDWSLAYEQAKKLGVDDV